MIATIRTTTGRESVVIDAIISRIESRKIPIKSIFHPTELRGYVFIEGESSDIEAVVRGIRHVRGLIMRPVDLSELEKFLIAEKAEIKPEPGDIVEIIGGPFKGERARITRVDETKSEVTVELLEAVIPIPVTISVHSIRIHEKKKKEV
jgi:transcriptional antiterminator NusG